MHTRSSITGRFVAAAEAFKHPRTTVSEQQYPYKDGDVTVLGPGIFVSQDHSVISWHGVNYVLKDK